MANSRFIADTFCRVHGHKFTSLPIKDTSVVSNNQVVAVLTDRELLCTNCGYSLKDVRKMRTSTSGKYKLNKKAKETTDAGTE